MSTFPLTTLSRRAGELQTAHILRENAATEHGRFARSTTSRANKAVKGATVFVSRVRAANETPSPDADSSWAARPTYRTGDGETQLTRRPGSEDHLKYKSLGFGTYSPLGAIA